MLTQIVVDSENAFTVPILGVTPKDPLLIRKVTGLNPPDIDLFIGDYSRDGGIYQGRRVGKRNVVLTIDLNPNPALGQTVSGWRDVLYKAFVDPQIDADYIKLNLHDDEGRVRYLVGYTEKFETEIFDVETMVQISVICPDPYIRDEESDYLYSAGGWITVPFTYEGTAETGFEAEIHVTTNTSVLTLDNNGKKMIINYPFVAGDVVYIDTIRGARSVFRVTAANYATKPGGTYANFRDRWDYFKANVGLTTPLIASLTATSPWIELHSQSNTLKTYGATTGDIISVVKGLAYTATYWGV